MGLTLQAISPMPELLPYWLNPTDAAVLVRYLNDHIAAMLLPRLEQAISVFPALRESVLQSPTAQARQFFYDTLVFDEATLKHLVHCFGDTQLMIGTDYPFNFHDDQPNPRPPTP